jgi:hypothetical protein
MKTRFLGSAATAAGLLLCIGIAPNVYAQQTVLNILGGNGENFKDATIGTFSTFTFQQSFILNSVGFVAGYYDQMGGGLVTRYKIDNGEWMTVTGLTKDDVGSTGVAYYTFSNPQTYAAGTQISIQSVWSGVESKLRKFDGINVAGITHSTPDSVYASGNLKVTALDPGSNVAPEPGSFALALTGGAALLGICVRRRRNAG